jgi:hypothetical protein
MNNKMAYSFFGIVLVLLFVVGIASSAGESFTLTILGAGELSSNPISGESGTSHTVSAEINYTGLEDVNVTWSGGSGDITYPTQTTISSGITPVTADITIPETGSYKQLIATYFNMSNASQELGSGTARIYFNITTPENNDTNTTTDEFDFCNYDRTTKTGFEVGSDLEIKQIKDKREDNEDEWEWKPLDKIRIEVEVENKGTEDEDYVIEIAFFENGEEIDVAEDDDDLEEEISLDEDEDGEVEFEFVIDGDIDSGDVEMHVKVYQDGDEDLQCVSQGPEDNEDVEVIDIKKSKNDVIVKEISGSNSAKAGSTITLEAKVANVGREDEDKVKVIAFSNELGIKIEKEIEDLDEGDTETVTFLIKLPNDVEEKEYKITFSTEFEYDDKKDIYREFSDEDDDMDYKLTVLRGVTNIAPRISADLKSDAIVGQELILSVLVTNNGDEENFIISTTGTDSWANVLSVNPTSINLGEAETQEVLITLNPTEGGYQTFKIVAVYGGETYEKQVTINIDELEVTEGFFSGSVFKENTSAYLIIGITALIILILLVLIVKMSRRKSGATF